VNIENGGSSSFQALRICLLESGESRAQNEDVIGVPDVLASEATPRGLISIFETRRQMIGCVKLARLRILL